MKQKIFKTIIFFIAAGVIIYLLQPALADKWALIYNRYFPCRRPIEYSLGAFDPKFGITKEEFLKTIVQAEEIWEGAIGKNLFEYKDNPKNLKVNLIYDYRQEATEKIRALGLAVNDTRASYDALKAKYETMQKNYQQQKTEYERLIAEFKIKQDAYNEKVEYWNEKGGAPEGEYKKIEKEAEELKAELAAIKKLENNINQTAADINSLVVVINNLAKTLNLNADTLNTIGKSRGEEFTEGEYVVDAYGQEIDIYEFSTKAKLLRVLAHELGHALGLDHVADPKAIMYRLNQSTSVVLTADDLTALKARCKIK